MTSGMNHTEIKTMYRKLSSGLAPEKGCELFGVGYGDAFKRLLGEYIDEVLSIGESASKFIIGPNGSGKTHFFRHFASLCRARNCVTADVDLNKNVDYTKSLVVYKELCKKIQAPNSKSGMKNLLEASIENLENKMGESGASTDLILSWIDGLTEQDFELPQFATVLQASLRASMEGDKSTFETTSRWLGGEIDNRALVKALPKDLFIAPIPKAEHEVYARDMMCSLCQFCKRAQFTGTVICYDEAEQGFGVGKKKQGMIMSLLRSQINLLTNLNEGSLLMMFALTPDMGENFDQYAALQTVLDDPAEDMGFFDGNTFAPKIDLRYERDQRYELKEIGRRLVDLFYEYFSDKIISGKGDVLEEIQQKADTIVNEQAESSNRRTMVKLTSGYLLGLRQQRGATVNAQASIDTEEDEA